MIYDKIENLKLYNIDKSVIDFINDITSDKECGRYEISEEIYANIEEYNTKDSGYFEAHRNYTDIQLLLEGEEIIEYTPLEGLEVKDEYNPSRDIAFYYDGENQVIKQTMRGWPLGQPRRGTLSFVTQKFFCFGAINNRRNIG